MNKGKKKIKYVKIKLYELLDELCKKQMNESAKEINGIKTIYTNYQIN